MKHTVTESAFDAFVCYMLKYVCMCVHLFCQQDGSVAVLLTGLGAQSDEPEQEQRQTGAPDHQLPVIVTLQERFMDVQQLDKET